MKMTYCTIATICCALAGIPAWAQSSAGRDDATFVSTATSPRVAYLVEKQSGNLSIRIDVDAAQENLPPPQVQLGVAGAAKNVTLTSDRAQSETSGSRTSYFFSVPLTSVVDSDTPAELDKLRIAFSVRWPMKTGGDLQRERFFCNDQRAPHAGLPANPANWQPFAFSEYQAQLAERQRAIAIPFDQPLTGKATLVIEDGNGKRIRNLVSGQPYQKGHYVIPWDGLDESGKLVAPGSYRWRAISHPGITPNYLFSFYNNGKPPYHDGSRSGNWLADHSDAMAATASSKFVYIGAPVAESGYNIIQLTPQGDKTNHFRIPPHIGQGGNLYLLADDQYLYALTEGRPLYEAFRDLPGKKWECVRPTSIVRYDATTGEMVPYDGPRGEKIITTNTIAGSGPKVNAEVPLANNLSGAAILNGMLYLSLNKDNQILAIDPKTGETKQKITAEKPGLLAANKETLLAFAGADLMRVDPRSGTMQKLFTPSFSAARKQSFTGSAPTGLVATAMTLSGSGEIYISDDGADQNIKVFSMAGKQLRTVGKTGGRPSIGKWDASGVYEPFGITIDPQGQLWVAERDSAPRRISVWNGASGSLVREFFGPCAYGAPGGSFDIANHTRWIGGGALWQVDFATRQAKPISTLYRQTRPDEFQIDLDNYSYNFYHIDGGSSKSGRTFLIAQGKYQSVYELKSDGTLHLWACVGSPGAMSQYPRWTLPRVFATLPGFEKALSGFPANGGPFHDRIVMTDGNATRDLPSVLWVDTNGDGLAQKEEFQIAGPNQLLQFAYWGAGNPTLSLKFRATVGGKSAALTLAPKGFLPSGAPNYNLAEAFASAIPLQSDAPPTGETVQDRFGRLIVNSSPMYGFAPDGQLAWQYPNQWIGVHGSHNAPLPETGVTQGVLWYLGTAPLDAPLNQAEVTICNGNHGRFFVMTTDGIYLDEMFRDVRVTRHMDAYMIGGECFGGYFGRAQDDGNYYLQSGHTDYRIFRIDGLNQLHPAAGTLTVTTEQISAAQRSQERKTAESQRRKSIEIVSSTAAINDTDPDKWPTAWSAEWGDANRAYPYAQTKILCAGDTLRLAWRVKDPSPWVNRGADWMQLFKTGDSVDFQFSTNPAANPQRSAPVAGDKRLLIAPFGSDGKPLAVLYSHRDPDASNPVLFSSPWRVEKVNRVTRLDSAKISVKRQNNGYIVTAAIPLADLDLKPVATGSLLGDFGVLYGDDQGSTTLLRSYYSNQATALVSDVPGEIMLNPRLWAVMNFQGETK